MTFEDLLKNTPLHIQNLAVYLRKIIKSADPKLQESVYFGDKIRILQFFIEEKSHIFFGLQATDKNCTIYIHHSDKVDVPMGLKITGNGSVKHIKFIHQSDIKPDILIAYLRSILQANPIENQKDDKDVKKPVKQALKKITIENPTLLMRKKKVSFT